MPCTVVSDREGRLGKSSALSSGRIHAIATAFIVREVFDVLALVTYIIARVKTELCT